MVWSRKMRERERLRLRIFSDSTIFNSMRFLHLFTGFFFFKKKLNFMSVHNSNSNCFFNLYPSLTVRISDNSIKKTKIQIRT